MLVPLLISLGLGVAAAVLFQVTWLATRARRRIPAKVVSLSVGSNSGRGSYGISPVFEYINENGKVVRAGAVRHGSSALMPKLGDVVDVFIDPSRPQQVSIERPTSRWVWPLSLSVMSMLWLYLAILDR